MMDVDEAFNVEDREDPDDTKKVQLKDKIKNVL